MRILFLCIACMSLLVAKPFEDLLGKPRAYLDKKDFFCHPTSCIGREQNYLDMPLLDDTIEHLETFSTHDDKVYKVIIHLADTQKTKDKEIDQALYQALLIHNKHPDFITYELIEVNDKYGKKAMIVIQDKRLQKAYVNYLTKQFLDEFSIYKEQK